MSRRFLKQFADGIPVIGDATRGAILDWGTTVPADGTAGYAPGCIFVDIDASGVAARYVNVGTNASCDFNLVDGGIDLATLTATAAQINAASAAASNNRTVTTTASIDATDHNKTIFLNSATGFVTTLPAPIAGFRCRVRSILQNTSGNHTVVTASSANIIKGQQFVVADAAGDAGTADDTISFVASQSVAGDYVDLESDGTSWFATAFSAVAAGMTFTQASA